MRDGAADGLWFHLFPIFPFVRPFLFLPIVLCLFLHTRLLADLCILPIDVRCRHLSSRGLCLADHGLSQRSPSLQSVASVPVCYLSCHVFAIANCPFSQRSASPQSVALVPVGYLSCHDFAIASLTVISHSRRRPIFLPSRHIWLCHRGC
jgi:hypothetical protein